MTVKLQITNLETFLEALQHCREQVALVGAPEPCCDLRTNTLVQDELRSALELNDRELLLTLCIYSREDYFRIVNSCASDVKLTEETSAQ